MGSKISLPKFRYLALDGQDGTVYCRVYGQQQNTPWLSFSENWRSELTTRTFLRMKNLVAFRGTHIENSMIGPGDSYGNLEKPDEKAFTISIQNGFPEFHQHPVQPELESKIPTKRLLEPHEYISLKAKWFSGKDKNTIQAKQLEYEGRSDAKVLFGSSLFPDSGLLELEGGREHKLPTFDATQVDLSSFKARLVANDQPFRIVTEPLPASDEYRPVSYTFGDSYAKECVSSGGGLFLETHDFTQTMTPLDDSAGGFITLGRWKTKKDAENLSGTLELAAVRVPYGYTLLVDKGCIHGDSTFKGTYMMSMTSNHITMQSANTVFLKNMSDKSNIHLTADYPNGVGSSKKALSPVALFGFEKPNLKDPGAVALERKFVKQVSGKGAIDFIFQPASKNYWRQLNLRYTNLSGIFLGCGAGVGFLSGLMFVYSSYSAALLCATAGCAMGALLGKAIYKHLIYAGVQSHSNEDDIVSSNDTLGENALELTPSTKGYFPGFLSNCVNRVAHSVSPSFREQNMDLDESKKTELSPML